MARKNKREYYESKATKVDLAFFWAFVVLDSEGRKPLTQPSPQRGEGLRVGSKLTRNPSVSCRFSSYSMSRVSRLRRGGFFHPGVRVVGRHEGDVVEANGSDDRQISYPRPDDCSDKCGR